MSHSVLSPARPSVLHRVRRLAALPPILAATASLLMASSPIALAASADGITTLVSRDTTGAGTPSLNGTEPSISTDGRFVTFEARDNFSGLNPTQQVQIWVRDRLLGTTVLASRADGALGAAGDSSSGGSSISADGRYVAFDSNALNLVPGLVARASTCNALTGGGTLDVFVRDLVAGTTRLISGALGSASLVANDVSSDPHISADGSTIGFSTQASNLFTGQPAPATACDKQLVVSPRAVVGAQLISRVGLNGAVGDQETDSIASLSSDGSKIAFVSSATNLVPGSPQGGQIYVKTIATGATVIASRADGAAGAVANTVSVVGDVCGHPSLNGDGHLVAFACDADLGSGSVKEAVYVRDVTAGKTILASRQNGVNGARTTSDASAPSISADGNTVAFETQSIEFGGTGSGGAVAVARDIAAGTSTTVSRASGAAGAVGNNNNTDIVVNGDGRVIAFEATSTNLTADTPPGTENTDVFVRAVAFTPIVTPSPTIVPALPKAGIPAQTASSSAQWLTLPVGAAVIAAAVGLARRRRRSQDQA